MLQVSDKQEHHMNVTLDEAIAIYAHASRSWFRKHATSKVQERISQLSAAGDVEGVAVHERVKTRIIELESASASDEQYSVQGAGN
jgi:hypothetical protein